VFANHPDCAERKLGEFLFELKTAGDGLYKRFLNAHGDLSYCRFSIPDVEISRRTGVYCFVVNDQIKYVGRSVDSFGKRINQG
jgi:hypothetical protein